MGCKFNADVLIYRTNQSINCYSVFYIKIIMQCKLDVQTSRESQDDGKQEKRKWKGCRGKQQLKWQRLGKIGRRREKNVISQRLYWQHFGED